MADINLEAVAGKLNRVGYEALFKALRQAKAIERLEATGRLDRLPPALREMARWRSANPELNLGELAARMKLSKSAVNHRLRRLQEMADTKGDAGSPTARARAHNGARRSA